MSYTTMLNKILVVGFILPSSGKNNVTWNSQECNVLLFMVSGCLFLWWMLGFFCGLSQAETNRDEHRVKNKGRDEQKQSTNYHRNKRT
jgi:hypothetical protein